MSKMPKAAEVEPAPVEGFVLKQGQENAGGKMKRSYLVIEKGRASWSLERWAPLSGEIDLSCPCQVYAGEGTTFVLSPLGGTWRRASFNGAGKGRALVFDADARQSDHSAEAWIQAFQIHIKYASRRSHMEFKWMWSNNRRLTQAIARLNPTRWSSWKDAEGTLIELQSCRTTANSSRPVDVKIERQRIIELKAFKNIGEAIEFLNGLLEQQKFDEAQKLLQQEQDEPPHLGVESLLHHREDTLDTRPSSVDSATFMSGVDGREIPVVLSQYEGHPEVRVFLTPKRNSEVVAEIDSGTEALCLGEWGEFVRIQWKQLEGWVGRKNVRFSSQASVTVSQFVPMSPGESAASSTEFRSVGNWPTSPATPNMARSNMPLHGVPVQFQSPKLGHLHDAAPDHFGDLQGTKDLAPKLLGGGMQLAQDMKDTVGTGDDAADTASSAWDVDYVVEAMRTSGSESMDATGRGQALLVPASSDASDSSAPDESKIQEAQSLLASMLIPEVMTLQHWRSNRRQSKHRRKSAPPPAETGGVAFGVLPWRRPLSTESIAETDEVSFPPSPQPLQPLNGTMPGFPAIELGDGPRCARKQKSLTHSGESQPLLQGGRAPFKC